MIEIKCEEIVMLNIDEIYPHRDNEKIHPMNEKALERLCKIIQSKQGFTTPIKVDAKTKTITSGHLRYAALKKLNIKKAPCVLIDYANEDMMLADLIADNALNEWREVNKSAVNAKLPEFDGMDFDLDFLGIEDFVVDPSEFNLDQDEKKEKEKQFILEVTFPDENEMSKTYNSLCSQGYIVKIK